MSPTAVSPMASPIGIRRKKGSVTVCRTGKFGCSSRVTTRQAESMKSPRPRASIRYSGQCWSTAVSAPDRGVVMDAATAGRSPTLVPTSTLIALIISSAGFAMAGLAPALLEQLGHESRPAGLMARANAGTVVAVEVFIKPDEIPPVGVGLELGDAPVDRPSPVRSAQENAGQASGELSRYVPEGRARSRPGWALDLEAGAVEMVELLKGLDQQVVDGKPDRPTPVGVSAEEARARFRRFVVHAVFVAIDDEHAGVVAVEL